MKRSRYNVDPTGDDALLIFSVGKRDERDAQRKRKDLNILQNRKTHILTVLTLCGKSDLWRSVSIFEEKTFQELRKIAWF